MADPLYALIEDGKIHMLSSDTSAWPHDLFPTRDVSTVDGVAVGWLAKDDGSYSAPPSPVVPVPTITRAQAKIQLRRASLRDQVEALITKADPEVQDWYAEAGIWSRENANVVAIAKQLKLKDGDVDDLFRAASLIDA